MGSVFGVVLGALMIRVLNVMVTYIGPYIGQFFDSSTALVIATGLGPIVFGVVVLAFLIFEPAGLARIWHRFKTFYRLWPFAY